MSKKGKLITFEGGDGGGKSTQLGLLATFLREKGRQIIETREPGGTEGGEAIRDLLVKGEPERWDSWTEFLLNNASRRDLVRRVILPAIQQGKWVLSDRYADSSRVYQGIVGGVPLTDADMIMFQMMGFPKPDLTIVLDVPVEEGFGRVDERLESVVAAAKENRYEKKGKDFHVKVRQAFLDLAESEPERFAIVDATKSIDEVAKDIQDIIVRRLKV